MLRVSSELSLTRQAPGMLAPWIGCVIGVACAVTFGSVALGSALLCEQLPSWLDVGLFQNGLTFFVSFWLLASFLPPWRLARSIRVAVLMPLAHLIVIACAWPVWRDLAKSALDTDATTVLATRFPLALAVGGGTVLFGVTAMLLARRRSGEWVHGFAMLALADLLLVGLWVPVACKAWPGGAADVWSSEVPLLAGAVRRVAFAIVPPTVIAIAFTAVALRVPRALQRGSGTVIGALLILVIVAVVARAGASARELLLYANFLPLMLAVAVVAIIAVLALGAVTLRRSWMLQRSFARRPRRAGIIVDDADEPAIGLEITSWLRGPRVVQRAFAVRTRTGTTPVRGAHLVAPIPLATTQLRVGEQLAVLEPGDDVEIAGEHQGDGDPFRTSAAPLADAIFISPAAAERSGVVDAALVMWRPCVAYLLIVSTIALPALAGIAAT